MTDKEWAVFVARLESTRGLVSDAINALRGFRIIAAYDLLNRAIVEIDLSADDEPGPDEPVGAEVPVGRK
jgi:hypothetical protein